jgi:hypothetical protein
MLFDLQGKRRRVVQATYLTLAVLMGGGLVLFGIGGDVSGGLFDAFSTRGGGSDGTQIVEDRVERNEARVAAKPKAEEPRKELVRDYYQLAVVQTTNTSTGFPDEAQDELRRAALHWDAYMKADPSKPDVSLARVALQLFDPTALNQPQQALGAARVVAQDAKDVQSYLLLIQYAALAGDKRTMDRGEQRALAAAPQDQREGLKKQIDQIKGQVIAQQLQTQGGAAAGGAPATGGQQGGGSTGGGQ